MPREQDILDELPQLLQEVSGMTPEMVLSPSGVASAVRLGGRVLVVEAKANARTCVLAEAARSVIRRAREFGPE